MDGSEATSARLVSKTIYIGKLLIIILPVLLLPFSCTRKQTHTHNDLAQKVEDSDGFHLLELLEIDLEAGCDKTLKEVKTNWSEHSLQYTDFSKFYTLAPANHDCYWTRLTFRNPDSIGHKRILYFPKGWQYLECYVPRVDGSYDKKNLGIRNNQEVLYTSIPSLDTLVLYIKYPERTKAYFPLLNIREMSEKEFLMFRSRAKYKFLFIGAMLFPFFFFLVQFMIQRDKLSLYYLVFLLGSATYLPGILDTIPFFELSHHSTYIRT